MGKGATIIYENIPISVISIGVLLVIYVMPRVMAVVCGKKWSAKGMDTKNNAFAGVGRPINEEVCLVSILKFASLSAEKTASKNARYGMYEVALSGVVAILSVR